MPGYQEILIISAIVLAVIFIPRIMNPQKPPPRLVFQKKRISGGRRAALAASAVYPLIVAAVMQPWKGNMVSFLYMGLGPVLIVWLIYWVVQGFMRR